ncbi:family 78 glycoside hydrolase catalytic domain [Chitinophaga sp. LS1]|uniref:family 78 glycoside hydrolase catalytic domain n=1 Tax=Chitinophaga sp. LS1 TaxID=3051176 RepID=UPI002AAA7984|nr:family 78 glycoside hydrolase catalytic domain [Chitinophaga sp. LS1]WPV69738.1 family 78 glycoside hydrolase catalytic domain [Chitinophaga sp. LS1]
MHALLLILLFHLRCETLENPVGIDVAQPGMSWEIQGEEHAVMQTAYQILVASTPEKLAKNEGDLWNSGRVVSDRSIQVIYKGKRLRSRQDCYWKVKVWTNKGESEWSKAGHWSMGLLLANDWKGEWIGVDTSFAWDSAHTQFSRLSARYYRKEFTSQQHVRKATLYIAGPGLYEGFMNGDRIGTQVLAQSPTDYRKTVRYNTYDVTSLVHKGDNAIGVTLGNGRYFTMRQNYKPAKINTFGYPRLLLQLELEYDNGKKQIIASDKSWQLTADGPIRTNNEYDGEEYDAGKEMPGWNKPGFKARNWQAVDIVPAPGGKLMAQLNEPQRITDIIKPVSIKPLRDKWIVDMGQNFAGWLQIKVKGLRGQQVTMRFAESLQKDGSLYVANLRDAKVTDIYTLKGVGVETWHPTFVYHGFRYVEISGVLPEGIEGQVINDDLTTIGTFETSDPTLNQIYQNAVWGIRSNYKGMPVDCPQRNERMPWLGDRTTGALGESFIFDNSKLYAKWLDDIEDAQTEAGAIPDVAPAYWRYYSDNMTWPAAYILIAGYLYDQFGDVAPMRKHYPSMKRWLTYMREKYFVDGIMTKDKYGDWCAPTPTDGKLIATAMYYHLLTVMNTFAGILHYPADQALFAQQAAQVKKSFNRQFRNGNNTNNTLTANLLPLYFDMVPENERQQVFKNIVDTIHQHGDHLSTGVIGTQFLMRALTENGRPDLAYLIAADRDYPGWGYMINQGATTIWELWNGDKAAPNMNSQNHIMLLGDLIVWFYQSLAGIKGENGFKHIIMNPQPVPGLEEVNASYQSMHGLIRSHWEKTTEAFDWEFTIPSNTTATIYLPANEQVQINGLGNDAKFIKAENDRLVYEIGSGDYTIHVSQPDRWKRGIVIDEDIFTTAPFPESHAATIAETSKGLVAAWFGGTKERNPDVGIWVSRQVAGKWTAPVEVANGIQNDTLRYACWNPVLFQMPGGDLLLFYKVGPNVGGWKGYMKTSKDGGISWSAARQLPGGFLGPVKNKPVLLPDGKLLCPSSTEGHGWDIHFEVTADTGKTWTMIGPLKKDSTINAIQPGILQYGNGKMQILCRNKGGNIVQSWSLDSGKTWSPLSLNTLPNNNSGTDVVSLQDGRQLIVYNHVSTPKGAGKGKRTPLNVSLSEDGIHWSAALVLEDSPVSQYSYPAVIQSSDGYIHIVYTWRRQRIRYVKIDPRQLALTPINSDIWKTADAGL